MRKDNRKATLLFYRQGSFWRWTLRAANGRIIDASTEGFASEWNARRNFELVKRMMMEGKYIDRVRS